VWTIDRILARAGVPKRRARNRYVPKGTPYPAAPLLLNPDISGSPHLSVGSWTVIPPQQR